MKPLFSKKTILNELETLKDHYLINFSDIDKSLNIKYVNSLEDVVDKNILDNMPSEMDIITEIKQYSDGLILDILKLSEDIIMLNSFMIYVIQKLLCMNTNVNYVRFVIVPDRNLLKNIIDTIISKFPNCTILYSKKFDLYPTFVIFDKNLKYPLYFNLRKRIISKFSVEQTGWVNISYVSNNYNISITRTNLMYIMCNAIDTRHINFCDYMLKNNISLICPKK